jgi:hypothetical protein
VKKIALTSFTDYPPGSFAASFAAGQTPRFVGDRPNGFVGGGQAGYNYQVNTNWLVGLDGLALQNSALDRISPDC